jgi:hypothetical protein
MHNDAAQSVGLLWTSDRLVAGTSTWQHTTRTTDKDPCPGGIQTHDLSRWAAAGDELITRPEESYRLCCVVVCDLETLGIGAPYIYIYIYIYIYDICHLRVNDKHPTSKCPSSGQQVTARLSIRKVSCHRGRTGPKTSWSGTLQWRYIARQL